MLPSVADTVEEEVGAVVLPSSRNSGEGVNGVNVGVESSTVEGTSQEIRGAASSVPWVYQSSPPSMTCSSSS